LYVQVLTGVSASDLQNSQADQNILIETFKSSLGQDANLTTHMNVSIASISDIPNRRLRENNQQIRLQSGVDVKFKIAFDVDKQQFLNVDDGISKITTKFTADASSGLFTETLHNNAQEGPLSTAVGASTIIHTAPETKTVALFYPTMQPTVSSKPSVLPTIMPSTQKPTLRPTTAVPSFAPTLRTGKVICFKSGIRHILYVFVLQRVQRCPSCHQVSE
jgi:hypothetical protein